MKNSFVNIVQKCICIDFLLNALINSNSYQYVNFLNSIKDENLKNIKIVCQMYEYLYKQQLILEDVPSIRLNKHSENSLNILMEYNLNVITDLEYLKHQSLSHSNYRLTQNLINSHFNFISLINCLYTDRTLTPTDSSDNNNIFFNLVSAPNFNNLTDKITSELIREISIDAINLFFNYSLVDNIINDEYYEVFFKNNPETKFYQYYFKSSDNIFKVRIFDNDVKVFYIYYSNENPVSIINSSVSKSDVKNLVDRFLNEKLNSNFYNLSFDEEYTNISYYMKNIETYKLKYNFKTSNKLISNSSLYVTVDAKSMTIQEISLF